MLLKITFTSLQTAEHVHCQITAGQTVHCSNWEIQPVSPIGRFIIQLSSYVTVRTDKQM